LSSAAAPHPEGQDGPLDLDSLGAQHLGLPIEWKMPGVFADQDVGHHRLSRQPALDQPLRCRRLDHRLLAGAAGVFGTMRHHHAELCRDHVEPLRGLLTDLMHGRPTAGAARILGCDRHVQARQMGGKRAALAAALLAAAARRRRSLLVAGCLVGRNGLFDILERQLQLLGILRAFPKYNAAPLFLKPTARSKYRSWETILDSGGSSGSFTRQFQ
jgi:hypothetical protein